MERGEVGNRQAPRAISGRKREGVRSRKMDGYFPVHG
jgi:hypothetical protein